MWMVAAIYWQTHGPSQLAWLRAGGWGEKPQNCPLTNLCTVLVLCAVCNAADNKYEAAVHANQQTMLV